MYREMIEKIESGTELARFALVNMTGPGTILPAVLVTLVNYYIYGFGDDSFFLPCPVMYDILILLCDNFDMATEIN